MASRSFPKLVRSLPVLAGLTLACPGALHAIDCDVYSVAALNYYFAQADANPQNTYTIYLRSTTPYLLTRTLTLTKGTVYLKSPTGALATADQYVLDAGYPNGGWKQAIKVVKGTSGYTPYLSATGITIKGGMADQLAGGGVYVKGGYVAIMNCYLRDNASSSLGTGLYVEGSGGYAYVYNSIIRDNKNIYAAPANPQQILCGGVQSGGGGLAVNAEATLTVEKSTIMGNQACRGGGIGAYFPSTLNVENSTISGNKANLTGGGIFLYGNITTTLSFNTISENQAGVVSTGGTGYWDEKYGGGIAMIQWEGTGNFHGNIVAKNQTVNSDKKTLYYDGRDCFDRFSSQSLWNRHTSFDWNFVGALANCQGTLAQSDGWWFVGSESRPVDPLLDPLSQKTGTAGPQYTYAPKSASGVIGNYWSSNWSCPYADQLGHRRDYYNHDYYSPTRCDMGSHQYYWYH